MADQEDLDPKAEQPAEPPEPTPEPTAPAAPAVSWLDLFKLAFGASGDADAAVHQANRATTLLATIKTGVGTALLFGLFLAAPARAQQVAQQFTCQTLLDGGTFAVCGAIPTNFSPLDVTCAVSVPGSSSAAATVNLWGSADGTHYGTIADGGFSVVTVVNGDGGVGTSVTSSQAISPFDPWPSVEIVASAIASDGGTGALNCYAGVIQSQTIHLAPPKKLHAK